MSDGWYNSGVQPPGAPGGFGSNGSGPPKAPFGGHVSAPGVYGGVSAPSAGAYGGAHGPIGGFYGGQMGGYNGGQMGHMDGHASAPQSWNPASSMTMDLAASGSDQFEIDDPPLLEELGIDAPAIWQRMQGVAFFKKLDAQLLADVDLSGPIVIMMGLGMCLVLRGKLQFGYIYGFVVMGFGGLYVLINLMSQSNTIDLYSTISILGYGLLPVVLLAALAVFVSLTNTFGFVLSIICILWCTATTSRFFETAVSLTEQRWLVAYPISLVYTCFVLITVF